MPIYEYACAACGHQFEEWQKMSDKPIRVCPKCKAKKVEKLISATSFTLKGGGWYADLYSSNKPKSVGGEAKPAAKTEGSGGAAAAPASGDGGGGGGGGSGGGGGGSGGSGTGGGSSSSGSASSGQGPVNSAPKVAAAKA
jgi:putative FmdB family regulatory protein